MHIPTGCFHERLFALFSRFIPAAERFLNGKAIALSAHAADFVAPDLRTGQEA
jgi:hypothetical protein